VFWEFYLKDPETAIPKRKKPTNSPMPKIQAQGSWPFDASHWIAKGVAV
jgi:hypothetical protein